MKLISISGAKWRRYATQAIDSVTQQKEAALIYYRWKTPVFIIIPCLLVSHPERMLRLQELTITFAAVFKAEAKLDPLERPPTVQVQDLRRRLNTAVARMNARFRPHLLTKYDEVIGFIVPLPPSTSVDQLRSLVLGFLKGSRQ